MRTLPFFARATRPSKASSNFSRAGRCAARAAGVGLAGSAASPLVSVFVALGALFGALASGVSAQGGNSTFLPAGFERLPGNAAVSMPIRWSSGRMQIIYDDRQLDALDGLTITRLRLRRPAFFDEPDYTVPVTRTFEIAMGPAGTVSQFISSNVDENLPDAMVGTMTTVFGPAPITIQPSTAPAQGDVIGSVIIDVPLSQPYTVQVVPGQHLLLDWKCLDGSLDIVDGGWVDAVLMPGGQRLGLAMPIGQFGCGGVGTIGDPSAPNRLDVDESDRHPRFGANTTFVLSNAQADSRAFLVLGLDAEQMAVPAAYGEPVAGLPIPTAPGNCLAWAPLDAFILEAGETSVAGTLRFNLNLPVTTVFQGMQLDAQMLVLEDPPQLAFSNGLKLWMDDVGYGGQISSNLTLRDAVDSPWGSEAGLAPIVEFVH